MKKPEYRTAFLCAIFLGAIAALCIPGCALLSKGKPGNVRYFSIEQAATRPAATPVAGVAVRAEPPEVRLGRITGAPHLEERLVFRNSTNEINYYQDLRWTEPPEQAFKRMLTRVMFEERGLKQVVGGAGPTLEIQLTAFDEILVPERLARAQVVVKLHDEHLVLWEETMTVDRPVAEKVGGDQAAETVRAFGEAMQATVDQVADRVVLELGKRK